MKDEGEEGYTNQLRTGVLLAKILPLLEVF
jgi:hypothetical protein